jgi:CheY-like chemotaxis protein
MTNTSHGQVLILDDDENRHIEFDRILRGYKVIHVYSASEAINALQNSPPFDLISLDHDLGEFNNSHVYLDPGDGTEVAEFINLHLEHDRYPKRVMIHSWNPEGARRMEQLIREVKIPVRVKPFRS